MLNASRTAKSSKISEGSQATAAPRTPTLPLTAQPAPPLPPGTALQAALARWRQRLLRTALVLFGVCLGIATLLTALDGGRFQVKLTYSLCIGLACTLVNDLSWFTQAALYDQVRRLRRLAPSPGPFLEGWTGTVPAAIFCLLAGPPLGQAAADAIFGFSSPSLLNFNSTSARVTLVISALATLVLILVVSAAERVSSARAQAEAAQRQAAENQLCLLQSQLEPHMLFNTLANLRVLIGLDPQRAQAMLDRLIGFLRATLAASRQASHPLAQEFHHTDDYLALMAVRMGPRLRVNLQLPPELATLPLPPLLLQPLVENAIKHGLEPKVEGGRLDVSARRETGPNGPQLVLQVRDTGVGLGAAAAAAAAAASAAAAAAPAGAAHTGGSGFGLEQVRTRLATLYGARASLQLTPAVDAEGGALATLTLPLD